MEIISNPKEVIFGVANCLEEDKIVIVVSFEEYRGFLPDWEFLSDEIEEQLRTLGIENDLESVYSMKGATIEEAIDVLENKIGFIHDIEMDEIAKEC